ncbi:MAG: site-specific tyrosine recombinase XerD [Bacteroidaceae bacterium]|nr:site-specific tyrosine recombinase XerD [Bacteroidaceae bacterium]
MDKSEKNILLRYHQYLKLEKSVSDNTIEAYTADLEKLISYLKTEKLALRDVTLDHLHNFAACLADVGIHPRSQARIISGIRSFFRFMLLDGYIDADPSELLELPRLGKHLPDVLSVEEIDTIINAIDLSKPEGQRNRAIIETLYSCGLRVSELCNLRISNLYLDEGYLRITGKGDKTRLVPISQRAIDELRKWFADRCHLNIKDENMDYVFLSLRRSTPLSRIMIFHIIKELVEITGIEKTVSPHTFRHSFATHLLEGGANLRAIQKMLGHESIATTEIYTHIDRSKLREEIITHHPRNIKYHKEHK